jgi:hypothetical protein
MPHVPEHPGLPPRRGSTDLLRFQYNIAIAAYTAAVRLKKLVTDFMIHKCAVATNGCKKTPTSACKRGYSNAAAAVPKTSINDKGYPVYRRRKPEDSNVVPYVPAILSDWDGHINVEYTIDVARFAYLYKYLFKGSSKKRVDFKAFGADNDKDAEPFIDQIVAHINARVLCSMDCMWRTYGFQTYMSPSPAVVVIRIKLPDTMEFITEEQDQTCDMLIYFLRPAELYDFTFVDLFREFVVTMKKPTKPIENVANMEWPPIRPGDTDRINRTRRTLK